MLKFEPFDVFISSHQTEFGSLRKTLAGEIDKQPFRDRRVMNAITIEDEFGPVKMDKITVKMNQSSVYIGVFGRSESQWTFAELRAARARGLPMLVYYYKKPLRRGRPQAKERRGRPSVVRKFLDYEVKPEIDINGYSKPYTSATHLIVDIMDHLAILTASMVAEAANVRKTIHKATVLPGIV